MNIKESLASIWPVNEWQDIENAKLIRCPCCREKYYVGLCQDKTTQAYYLVVPDETLRRQFFILFTDTILSLPFVIKRQFSLLIQIITLNDFFNRANPDVRSLLSWLKKIIDLWIIPIAWTVMIINAFLGAVTPFKDGPKDARNMYAAF